MNSIDAADLVWQPVSGTNWHTIVVYKERAVRDWRWLWLRKRIKAEIVSAESR